MPIRIVSLNIWGGREYGAAMRFIEEVDADVLCLQEVNQTAGPVPLWLVQKERTSGKLERPNLFSDIAARLPNHQGIFCAEAHGFLHDGEKRHGVQYGNATFVRRSYPIIRQCVDFAYGKFRDNGFGEAPLPRAVHALQLFDLVKRKPFVVSHMHGMWLPNGKLDTPERVFQFDVLAHSTMEIADEAKNIVVCGDFNVLPESAAFDTLGRIGLRDLVARYGITDTRTPLYAKEGPRYADYMLVSNAVFVRSFSVPAHPVVSDHRPLILDMEVT